MIRSDMKYNDLRCLLFIRQSVVRSVTLSLVRQRQYSEQLITRIRLYELRSILNAFFPHSQVSSSPSWRITSRPSWTRSRPAVYRWVAFWRRKCKCPIAWSTTRKWKWTSAVEEVTTTSIKPLVATTMTSVFWLSPTRSRIRPWMAAERRRSALEESWSSELEIWATEVWRECRRWRRDRGSTDPPSELSFSTIVGEISNAKSNASSLSRSAHTFFINWTSLLFSHCFNFFGLLIQLLVVGLTIERERES